jgi:5'(3')-deoxyribonucleotidase
MQRIGVGIHVLHKPWGKVGRPCGGNRDRAGHARFKSMARICVDMDEVMADTVAEHLRRYNADFGTDLTHADLDGKWLWQCVPEAHHATLEGHMQEPEFFGDLPIMPDAQRVLERLNKDHEVFIASAAMEVPRSFAAKFRWLEEHFPFIRPSHIVFCGDKSILAADYLIDDNPRQLRAFRGKGLMFSASHNKYEKQWPRMENWLAVEEFFYGKDAKVESGTVLPFVSR